MRPITSGLLAVGLLSVVWPAGSIAQDAPDGALLFVDFARGMRNRAGDGEFIPRDELKRRDPGWLEFSSPRANAVLNDAGTLELSKALRHVDALTVGGWFQTWRSGEQTLAGRGEIRIGPLGERFFRPSDTYINFCLGTDERGLLMGTINGNGGMPFVHVTVNDVPIQVWQQLVITKDSEGFHAFYQNGTLIHTDRRAISAPSRQPWHETDEGARVPLRLQMPTGGLIGEIWVVGRALSVEEIAADYEHKRMRYTPAPPGKAVALREMHQRPPGQDRFNPERARAEFLKLLGPFPETRVPLDPRVESIDDCGAYIRRKISIQVEPDDRLPAYVLVPKNRGGRLPAVVCFYGTTSGAGKQTTVGLSGRRPGDPPHPNLSFAIDLAEAGFIAFAADYLRDGERIHPGDKPYDTTRFYEQHPDWSIHGKDAWDTMRAIDYLQSLDEVDPEQIGMAGHSYGGHSTIFTAAVEPRIRVAVANGPVSAFREHGGHWAVPKGAGNSQSLPALRPYLLAPERELPVSFAEVTALIAPRALWVGQAAGERRPCEEENAAIVSRAYQEAGAGDRVRHVWYAGDHDFPPEARQAMVAWFRRGFGLAGHHVAGPDGRDD
jgi:dienelactone hydrolase